MPYLHWDTKNQMRRRRIASQLCEMSTLPKEVKESHTQANFAQDTKYRTASILSNPPLCLPLSLENYRYPASFPENKQIDEAEAYFSSKPEAGTELVVHHLWLVTVGPSAYNRSVRLERTLKNAHTRQTLLSPVFQEKIWSMTASSL